MVISKKGKMPIFVEQKQRRFIEWLGHAFAFALDHDDAYIGIFAIGEFGVMLALRVIAIDHNPQVGFGVGFL